MKEEDPQLLGKELARVLLDELNSQGLPEPRPSDKARWIEKLEVAVPIRGGAIGFQVKDGQDVFKSIFSKNIASEPTDEDCKRLFCMIHNEFVPVGCVANDHVYPYAKMRVSIGRLTFDN